MELMQTLDDSWNDQDLKAFNSRHADDVVERWPGRPETHRPHNHEDDTAFPDQHLDNRPEWTTFMKQVGLA